MLDDIDTKTLKQLREDFRQIVEVYNAAIRTGKVRTIRPATAAAHRAIFALSKAVGTLNSDQVDLLTEVEAAFMDVRWGRLVGVQP